MAGKTGVLVARRVSAIVREVKARKPKKEGFVALEAKIIEMIKDMAAKDEI